MNATYDRFDTCNCLGMKAERALWGKHREEKWEESSEKKGHHLYHAGNLHPGLSAFPVLSMWQRGVFHSGNELRKAREQSEGCSLPPHSV